MRSFLVAAVSLALLSGCSITGRPVQQTVQVETPGCERVSCELSNDRGQWHLPGTPGSVLLTTSQAPLSVVCRAEGGLQGHSDAVSSTAPNKGSGAVIGGAAGGAAVGVAAGGAALSFIPVLGVLAVATGVLVGATSGSTAEALGKPMHYPALISVPMNCAPPPAAGTQLGMTVRGLSRDEAVQAGLGERTAVRVMAVADGGRAAAGGLRGGDVILAASGRELTDAAELEALVLSLPAGAALPLRVWRAGAVVDVNIAGRPRPAGEAP